MSATGSESPKKCLSVRRVMFPTDPPTTPAIMVELDDKVIHLTLQQAESFGQQMVSLSRAPSYGVMMSSAL